MAKNIENDVVWRNSDVIVSTPYFYDQYQPLYTTWVSYVVIKKW